MLLKDKVAIITGAASARGLGFATAKLFAENGAKVVIIDLNGEASKTAAAALGEGHLGLAANVADEVQVQAAIEQILAKYGRVDVLVNNAGITQPLKLMDIKRANYDAVLDVSLRGTLLMSQAVIPTMRAQKSAPNRGLPNVADNPHRRSVGDSARNRASPSCSRTPRLLPTSSCHSSTMTARKCAKFSLASG